jgi:glutathione synthase/RimK-type ligase-like ATP-grasp enzyme
VPNRRLYWITSEKAPEGYPSEDSIRAHLRAAGYEVTTRVWDREPLPELRPGELLLVRSPWDYFTKLSAFESWLADLPAKRVLNPRDVLLWNIDKRYLAELEALGVPAVPTVWMEARDESEARERILSAFPGREIVIKPAKSAAAHHTYRLGPGETPPLGEYVRRLALIQPFLPEIERDGERSIVFLGGEASHAIRKVPKEGDFRVQQSHGGRFAPFEPSAPESDFAAALVGAASRRFESALSGRALPYARVDYVLTADGPRLMELEVLEPDLYFHFAPDSAKERFARVLDEWIRADV